MLLYSITRCLRFNLVVMFGSRETSGLSGCCDAVHMHSVGEERNAYKSFFSG